MSLLVDTDTFFYSQLAAIYLYLSPSTSSNHSPPSSSPASSSTSAATT